jgi:hypothetical protein
MTDALSAACVTRALDQAIVRLVSLLIQPR